MIRSKKGRNLLGVPLLAAALSVGSLPGLTTTPAFAQNEPPGAEGEGDKSGRPLDGYLATGCLVGLAMFLVGKTARRQVSR